jgi:coiled-coil domain-containing protein 130
MCICETQQYRTFTTGTSVPDWSAAPEIAKMQGFNMGRYVPPEFEGLASGNKLNNKHALGSRAKNIKAGILTVRFEMPYAVWCNHCPKPTIIGQGVRFNAEKKKVGNYHSTPVYSFRMKHAACGGLIEIRTDPKNTAYVVTEGGKARDTGEDRVREGEEGMEILSVEEREKRREDAFATLEGRAEEKAAVKDNKRRIQELQEERERHWDDPHEASRRLRKGFRAERKVRHKTAAHDEGIKDRMSLAVKLLPETEEDRQRASFVDFGNFAASNDEDFKLASKPLFKRAEIDDDKKTKALQVS